MRLIVAAVGRVRAPHFDAACRDYLERLQHSFPTQVVEIRDARRGGGGTADRWRAEEGAQILAALPPGGRLLALDERGATLTSRAFADYVGQARDRSVPALVFAIGGPDGLDERVRQAAAKTLAFGAMTLPHELARVVLLEQLYRAASILANSPYHRD